MTDLAALRHRAGLTQQQAATLLGVSVRTMQDWEQGRHQGPAMAMAEKLLATLTAHKAPQEPPNELTHPPG